jgi:endonuclease/exonuclease/phosphatase family metal-dependent hydrolase
MKNWRLITYNIHKGVAPFKNLSVIDRVKLSLQESKADFLLLQEVGERNLGRPKTEKHLEILADNRWPHRAYGQNAVFPTKNHGNAVLSAVPIRKFHNQDLTIYPVEKRGLLHCELEWPSPGLHLCSVHLDLFEFTRRQQVEKLIRYLTTHVPKNAPLILGGDFNDWAEKVGFSLAAELGVIELSAPSFPSWHPILKLDRLYVRGVKVNKFEALTESPWNRLSDHLPLCLEFSPTRN